MSNERVTLGPGNEHLLTLEKIQHGIKDFFAQRGMFGDNVIGCQADQNMTYGLNEKESKIDNLIKKIVEKSTLDVANLRQMITLWDKEERATCNSFIDESSYGVVTQQKIKQHLKTFFSERLRIAEQEEGKIGSANSALKIFARTGARKETQEPSIGQVLNPVVSTIDTAGKTKTLQKTQDLERDVESPVSEVEPRASFSATSEERWTPNLAVLFPDNEGERPDNLDQVEMEETCRSPGLSEEVAGSPLKDTETDYDDPFRISTGSPESTRTASNMDTGRVDSLEGRCSTIPAYDGNKSPEANNLPNGEAYTRLDLPEDRLAKRTSDAVGSDLELPEDRVQKSYSIEAVNADLESPEDVSSERMSSEGRDDDPELPESLTASLLSPRQETFDSLLSEDLQRRSSSEAFMEPEDSVVKKPSSEAVPITLQADEVAKRVSPEGAVDSVLWPEDVVMKRSSSQAVNAGFKSPEEQVLKRLASTASLDNLKCTQDIAENTSSLEPADTDPKWQEVAKTLALEHTDLQRAEVNVAKLSSLEPTDTDPKWEEVAKTLSLELDHIDLQRPEVNVAKLSSSEAVDTEPQWAEDNVTKIPSLEPVADAEPSGRDAKVASTSPSEVDSNSQEPEEWLEDRVTRRSCETVGRGDLKSPEDREAKLPSTEAAFESAPQLCDEPEVSEALLEEVVDVHLLDVKRTSVEMLEDVDVISSERRVSQMSLNDNPLSDYVVPKSPSAEAYLDSLSAEVEDRVSRKSSSPADLRVPPKLSEDRVSRKSSDAEFEVVPQLSEGKISRRSSSQASDVGKLSEERISRRSSSQASDVGKLSEERISRRSSSKAARESISRLSEDRISRRSSSKSAVSAISKLSEDRISRRSSSRLVAEADLKFSRESLSESITETDEQELSSEAAADLDKTSPEGLERRTSLWKRWKSQTMKIQPILGNCPRTIMDCIRAKPALRPIFNKIKSMWKTHYGRRKSKRVKGKPERIGERPPLPNVSDERAETPVITSILSVELPPSDDDDDDEERTRNQSAKPMVRAQDIHSFFENMFKNEFSKRLETSLKRGLLDVVNDYFPEKGLPGTADKLSKQEQELKKKSPQL
ncbi:uncharacterized protein ACBT44_008265 [Syngnathus typhle]